MNEDDSGRLGFGLRAFDIIRLALLSRFTLQLPQPYFSPCAMK